MTTAGRHARPSSPWRRGAATTVALAVLGIGGWAGTALTSPADPATVAPSAAPSATLPAVASPAPTTPESSGAATPGQPGATGGAAITVPAQQTFQPPQPEPVTDTVAAFEAQVVALVNEERSAAGCSALTPDSRLAAAARAHSADMAARGYFSHDTPEGVDFATRISDAGYRWSAAAENIAAGQPDPASAMRDWMNSDGHRHNILNCGLRHIGVGLAYASNNRPYWTQDFASPG